MKVYDSSLATERACWLNVDATTWIQGGDVSAHLNERQALEIVRRLLTWLSAPYEKEVRRG